jgi:hypothetical protein
LGDKPQIARSLLRLGNLACSVGDDAAARSLYEESLLLERELGARPDMLHSLTCLTQIALRQGDYHAVGGWSQERLDLALELHDQQGVLQSLADAASAADQCGQAARAARLRKPALALLPGMGTGPPALEAAEHNPSEINARTARTDIAFGTAGEGRAVAPEEAAGYALESEEA